MTGSKDKVRTRILYYLCNKNSKIQKLKRLNWTLTKA